MTASGSVSATTRSRNFPSSIEPTKARISFPDTSFHASMRSASEPIGVSESVECWVCQRRREKLSTTETSWPRAEKRIAVGQPRYPSPPRIRTLMIRARVADPAPARVRSRERAPANAGVSAIYSLAAVEGVLLQANLLPPELTAIRITGLAVAVAVAAFAIVRRSALRNIDVIILLLIAAG